MGKEIKKNGEEGAHTEFLLFCSFDGCCLCLRWLFVNGAYGYITLTLS